MLTLLKSALVCCIVCGFAMPMFHEPKLQMTINVYCLTALVTQCLMCITFLFIELYSMVYSATSVLEFFLHGLAGMIIIYYKIKFLTSLKANLNTVRSVAYVDQALESLLVSVPKVQETIKFSLLLLAQSFFLILCLYDAYIFSYSSSFFGIKNACECIYFLYLDFSYVILFQYCYFIIMVLRHRLQLTRCALEKFQKYKNRNIAWSVSVSLEIIGQQRPDSLGSEVRKTCKLIGSVYRIIYESLLTVNQLYSIYFRYYLLALILWIPKEIVSATTQESTKLALFSSAISVTVYAVFLFTYMSISTELKYLQSTLNCFYHKQSLQNVKENILILVYQSAHRETKFSCGLVDIDFSLFSIMLDFISLIVFSIL